MDRMRLRSVFESGSVLGKNLRRGGALENEKIGVIVWIQHTSLSTVEALRTGLQVLGSFSGKWLFFVCFDLLLLMIC